MSWDKRPPSFTVQDLIGIHYDRMSQAMASGEVTHFHGMMQYLEAMTWFELRDDRHADVRAQLDKFNPAQDPPPGMYPEQWQRHCWLERLRILTTLLYDAKVLARTPMEWDEIAV